METKFILIATAKQMNYLYHKNNVRYYERLDDSPGAYHIKGTPCICRYKVIYRHPENIIIPQFVGYGLFLKIIRTK